MPALAVRSSLSPRLAPLALRLLTLLAAVLLLAGTAQATTVQRVTTPAGIEVWLVEDHTVPLIAMDFAFRGGASQDPAGRPGVASLLSTLLDEGAGDMDGPTFQRRLDETAVRLSFDAGRDAFSGHLGTLADRREQAFDLLALALNEPRFDADAIERMRAQLLSSLRRNATDPEEIATRTFSRLVFGDHPYARPVEGTPETMAEITRDDIVAYREATFARSNLVIGVVGAVSAADLGPLVDKAFAGLPETAKLVEVPEAAPTFGDTASEALPNPQTVIRIGTGGLLRQDPDYIPAYVLNEILGGGTFSSRLYTEIREKRGLAYSTWSAMVPLDHAGLFLAGTATRADKAGEVVELMTAEIRKMAEAGPSEQELAATKKYLVGSYALRFDSSAKIAAQLVGLQLDGMPIDYFDTRNALIEAVTLDDLRRVAKRLLSTPLTVVTVGPTSS